MAADRRPNKNSATEDEVGLVHSLTTKLYTKRLQKMLEQIDEGIDIEAVIGDGRILVSAGKWATDNNSITTMAPEMDSNSELNKELARIKEAQMANMKTEENLRKTGTTNNVVQFDDKGEF